jgi:hypothetical protein
MASLTHHHNKKTGVTYLYSVASYWDKAEKAPRNRQICIGKLDDTTGEVVPTARKRKLVERASAAPGVTASVRIAGPFLLQEKLSEETGLTALVRRCFPQQHEMIMSLAHFNAHKGLPLSRSASWSAGHLHPGDGNIASQRISELLAEISEDDRQRFLSLWLAKMTEDDYLCYDISSVSSYSRGNEHIKYGYKRDGESLPQINLAMLFGQKSRCLSITAACRATSRTWLLSRPRSSRWTVSGRAPCTWCLTAVSAASRTSLNCLISAAILQSPCHPAANGSSPPSIFTMNRSPRRAIIARSTIRKSFMSVPTFATGATRNGAPTCMSTTTHISRPPSLIGGNSG